MKSIIQKVLSLALLFTANTPISMAASEPFSLPSPLPAHPRLLAAEADWSRLQKQIHSDPVSARLFATLEGTAKRMLTAPPSERTLVGRRMLGTSRQVLDRVTILATVARVSGEKSYSERAALEMRAAADFTDWHPEHFLDTAEMSLALAIGYDWLFDRLTNEDRQKIAGALLEKGIQPTLTQKQNWISGNNNWNQVCHGGISSAAIAIADLQPQLAVEIVQRAIDNVPKAAKAYSPDGAYAEGPGYWNYGTSYHVVLAAALERLNGQAYGLDAQPGFPESAVYMAEVTAPSGRLFDYGDSRESRGFAAPLFWMARRFGHPEWLRFDLENLNRFLDQLDQKPQSIGEGCRFLALALLWRDSALKGSNAAPPLDWLGRGVSPIAIHRSAFEDPSAFYLGIKGGCPATNHAHMDVGSFVLEADGVRWALDLGMQDYNSLESNGVKGLFNGNQNSERWGIFRLGPESHNILRFNGAPQIFNGHASFVRFKAESAQPHSVVELTSLYADQVASVYRGVMRLPNRSLLLQDEWTAAEHPVEVTFQWITRAHLSVHPSEIQLAQEGKTLTLRILEPADAKIEIQSAKELQKPIDADNPGIQRITITTSTDAGKAGQFRILAVPGSAGQTDAPEHRKLLDWSPAL